MNRQELEKIIDTAFDWQNYQGNVFWVRLHSGPSNDMQYQQVSKSDLALLHPLLPKVISSLIKTKDKMRSTIVAPGPMVRDHYAVLTNTVVRSKNMFDGFQTMSRVWDIKGSKIFDMMLDIQGVRLVFAQQDVCGPSIPVIESSGLGALAVRISDMEEFYPGFAQRWEVAQTLGLSGQERLAFLLNQTSSPTSPAVEMSNVSF